MGRANRIVCKKQGGGVPPPLPPRHNMLRSAARRAVEVRDSMRFAHSALAERARRNKAAELNRTLRDILGAASATTSSSGLNGRREYREHMRNSQAACRGW